MSDDEKGQILKVLTGAIVRETSAFNYYYKGSENTSLPSGVRGILARLAEEERQHRRILMNEYRAVDKGWNEDQKSGEGKGLSYELPGKLLFNTMQVASYLEAASIALPSALVGGDNIQSCIINDRGEQTGTLFLLYDVIGHSIETTGINALAARVIGEYLEASSSANMEAEMLSPKRIVRMLNRKIHDRFEGQGVFLTMLCALFDRREAKLTFTLAGHEPPFLVRDDGCAGSLLNTQLIVGIDPEYPYREHTVPFEKGDVLCVFSDGIIEARNPAEEMFARDRVSEILETRWRNPPASIIEDLLKSLSMHIAGREIEDEISILIVRSKGE